MAAEPRTHVVERFTAVAGVQSSPFGRGLEIGPGGLAGPLRAAGLVEQVDRVVVRGTSAVADASVDLVVAAGVLHRVDEPAALVAEAVRVLAPGGRLVVWGEPTRVLAPAELVGLLRTAGLVGVRSRTDGLRGSWFTGRGSVPPRRPDPVQHPVLRPGRWRTEGSVTAFKPR